MLLFRPDSEAAMDILIKNGHVVDPVNHRDGIFDVAVAQGKIESVEHEIPVTQATQVIDAEEKLVMPGIIDMHTHMCTNTGHPHAQRIIALAGVTTTLDMAGPVANILDSISTAGAGVNIAILEAARCPLTLSSPRPEAHERQAFLDHVLSHGGIGIKLLGGHFPMDLDICSAFIQEAAQKKAWIAWHAGNTEHGSNIEGALDAIEAAQGNFLHLAHVNSYCRGQITDVVQEAQSAIEALKKHPNVFSESYLSDLNGTRLSLGDDGLPISRVTRTCLLKLGFTADRAGMIAALKANAVGVLVDDGKIGRLAYGKEALKAWQQPDCDVTGSFSVNPAESRFLLAGARRDDHSFVVDSFSTDGGCYPRNVIVPMGMLLVKFGYLTLKDFVIKASVSGAKALGLPRKGHLTIGADADITVIDVQREQPFATIVCGKVIALNGELRGKGTTIICDPRSEKYLRERGIACCCREEQIPNAQLSRVIA